MARPVPKGGKQIPRMFYVPRGLWSKVRQAAKRERVSMSEVVRRALVSYLPS